MISKKRGLGRGLDALLSLGSAQSSLEEESDQEPRTLALERIRPGAYQPRREIASEQLQELAASIREQGVVQPIIVRPIAAGEYEIVAGERRWRAAQLAQLREIPVVVRKVPDRAALSIALIENIQREDLNSLEEAQALSRLVDEFGLTHEEVAEAVGRSRTAVSNLLRLLELDEEVKRLLDQGQLEMGHARALLPLPHEAQRRAARQIAAKGLSVREVERLVRRLLQDVSRETPAQGPRDPNLSRLEQDLSERLGAKIALNHTAKGKGRLVIHYHSLEQLDGILSRIK
ncbi:MAG: ParB/RepB/Spo0J family partition protein [Gammaproteobacteria bacterium]